MHTLTITHTNIHPSVPTRTHTRTHTYTYTHSKKAEQAAAQEALRAIMNEGQQQLGGTHSHTQGSQQDLSHFFLGAQPSVSSLHSGQGTGGTGARFVRACVGTGA
jgi:hypothetical protein